MATRLNEASKNSLNTKIEGGELIFRRTAAGLAAQSERDRIPPQRNLGVVDETLDLERRKNLTPGRPADHQPLPEVEDANGPIGIHRDRPWIGKLTRTLPLTP